VTTCMPFCGYELASDLKRANNSRACSVRNARGHKGLLVGLVCLTARASPHPDNSVNYTSMALDLSIGSSQKSIRPFSQVFYHLWSAAASPHNTCFCSKKNYKLFLPVPVDTHKFKNVRAAALKRFALLGDLSE